MRLKARIRSADKVTINRSRTSVRGPVTPAPPLKSLLWTALALCSVLAGPASAEPETPQRWVGLADTLFTHHTDPEAGSGTAIVQDRSGFIWLGTQTGLVRWDGYRFHRYAADAEAPGSLPDSFILSLHIDERGSLWIGTSAGGLARYDAEHDTFVKIGEARGAVLAITGDGEGGLWIATDRGLDHVEARRPDARVAIDPTESENLPAGGMQAVLNDRDGTLWVGTRHGVWRRTSGSRSFVEVSLGAPASDSEPAITQLFQDGAGRIWVGTQAHGAFRIESDHVEPVRESGGTSTLQTDSVLAITESMPGRIWLGTDGEGIVEIDSRTGATHRIRHYPDTPTSLSDDYIYALFRDRSGLVWVANIAAISQHDPQQQAVVTLFGTSGRPAGLSAKKVYAVTVMSERRIWLSAGGGIDIFDPVVGRIGQLSPDPAHPETALPKGRVQAMVRGAGNDVYVATQLGLYRTDIEGRAVNRVHLPGRNLTAGLRSLYFESGTLWLGGDLDGLWSVNMHDPEHPVILSHEPGPRLGDARVTSLNRGAGSDLWVGTRASLARVDIATGSVLRVPADSSDPTQLLDGYVASTLVDRRGRLWVASFGSGVQVLESGPPRGDWRFRRLGLQDGLPHLGVDKLLEDSQGNIWASTDDGLAVIDGTTLAVQTLQRPQGVGMRIFWTDSGAVTANGEVLFGANGGLTVVRPELLSHWAYRPPVVVTDIRSGGRSLPIAPLNEARSATPLRVDARLRGFKVEFAALDYSAPERNRYAYRLLGFDTDWIAADANGRQASYTNLPPGDYTLQLRGSNRDGEWSPTLELPISVESAWYQTFSFKSVAALALLAFMAALVQIRTMYLRQRQKELQALVNQRTAELEKRSDELRDSQRQLELIAYNDPLTGLPNRRLFDDELKHRVALALREAAQFTLLLVDLDGFKKINDTLGHDAGDALLVSIAVRLKLAVREVDRVSRLGGDEFAVILAQTSDLPAVDLVCRRILASIAEPIQFKNSFMRVTASIGSAQCPDQGTTTDSIYKAADTALYDAKRNGRNVWCWYGQHSEQTSAVTS